LKLGEKRNASKTLALLQKIIKPKLEHQQRPKFFVVRGLSGLVFSYQFLSVVGIEKSLILDSLRVEHAAEGRCHAAFGKCAGVVFGGRLHKQKGLHRD